MICSMLFFFFFKQKTAYEMRISDWSSDVCSSDLASFLAGGEFPIPVLQSGGGQGTGAAGGGNTGITVEFKPFGVSLGFTPTVLADNTINLLVEPAVSAIDQTASITVGGLVIPGLSTRRASTVLELRDGESFAIAGLIQR